MSLFMLHTDITTDLIQGKSPTLDRRIASVAPRELCISAVTRGELLCALSQQMLQKKGRESKSEAPAPKEIARGKVGHGAGGGDKDSDLGDVIVAQPLAFQSDQMTAGSLRKTTHAMLAALTPREARVLRMRFGIDTSSSHTLEEVAEQFNVTRDRIRLGERTHILSRVLDQFLTRVLCLPWDEEAATHFARVAVDLHRSGSSIGSMDTMIAGHAIAVGAVLVTNNERHFGRITGLKIENWTRG